MGKDRQLLICTVLQQIALQVLGERAGRGACQVCGVGSRQVDVVRWRPSESGAQHVECPWVQGKLVGYA